MVCNKNFGQSKIILLQEFLYINREERRDIMSLREKMLSLKRDGVSIKFMALKTEITESTLYAFSSGARELSKEKAEKLENLLNTLLSL